MVINAAAVRCSEDNMFVMRLLSSTEKGGANVDGIAAGVMPTSPRSGTRATISLMGGSQGAPQWIQRLTVMAVAFLATVSKL